MYTNASQVTLMALGWSFLHFSNGHVCGDCDQPESTHARVLQVSPPRRGLESNPCMLCSHFPSYYGALESN